MAGLTQPRCSAHKRFGDDDRDGDYDHDGDNKGEDIVTQYAMYHIVSQILKILLVMTLMILQSLR